MTIDVEPHALDTRTARIALRDDGIVQVTIRAGLVQSAAEAGENLSGAIALTDGVKRPLLVDIRSSEPLEPEARHHYTGPRLVESFSALALLIESSAFGRMLGNVYLRVAKPPVPTKLFVSENKACRWLADFIR